jgi:predicted porin
MQQPHQKTPAITKIPSKGFAAPLMGGYGYVKLQNCSWRLHGHPQNFVIVSGFIKPKDRPMNKLLLGTSALVGAIAFAGAAMADAPKVTLGGFVNFQAGYVSEDSPYDANKQDVKFRNDTEIHVRVDGKSDNGLGYGAVIELEADQTQDRASQDSNADKTFVYLEGGWGRFELGGNVGVTKTMKVDAATFARATGGIDGDWWLFAGGPAGNGYIISPDLVADHGTLTSGSYIGRDKTGEDANKITYYSPRFSGFQVGFSYTPDLGDTGQNATALSNVSGVEDIISGGINYNNQFGDIGLTAALTGEWGDSKLAAQEDLRAWNVGGALTWSGFTFGASYGSWGDSLQASGASNDDSDYWTLGLAYDFGPFGASATYLSSQVEQAGGTDNEFQNIALGLDYMLAPGLVPYVEVNFFEFDDAAGAGVDNEGTTVLVGTQLTF